LLLVPLVEMLFEVKIFPELSLKVLKNKMPWLLPPVPPLVETVF